MKRLHTGRPRCRLVWSAAEVNWIKSQEIKYGQIKDLHGLCKSGGRFASSHNQPASQSFPGPIAGHPILLAAFRIVCPFRSLGTAFQFGLKLDKLKQFRTANWNIYSAVLGQHVYLNSFVYRSPHPRLTWRLTTQELCMR